MTRLGVILPAPKFRLDASGRPVPAGYIVNSPPLVLSTAVTLMTIAVAVAGAGSAPTGIHSPP